MIALGIIASIYFGFFGTGWQVTGEMTRWGGEFLELFGLDTSKYSYYKMTNLSGSPLTRYEGCAYRYVYWRVGGGSFCK